ncbi:MAG: N-acetylmuramoyl-L-alanine amidase [Paludibacteraceae bacterium]
MKNIIFTALLLLTACSIVAQDMSGIRIYINPGHGGYDSDDRNVVIPPFVSGDHNGFWESKSNLDKGLQLKAMLDAAGATTFISRTTNTTTDDLPLSQIVAAANASGADFMISIHSNAGGGTGNSVLMLYAGKDPNDSYTYPTPTPMSEESRAISTVIAQNLYENQLTNWSSGIAVRGDKTFARTVMGWSNGYGVMRGLTIPGVISEGSMHDYIPETYRLMNSEYRHLEAWHFLKSFCTYFKSAQIPTGVIAGIVRDKYLQNEANYYKRGTDEYLPINGATVILNPGNIVYTTDNLFNGVYVFKNLTPGNYTLIAQHSDYHNDTTHVLVDSNNISYNNIGLNQIRNTPPKVLDYSPKVLASDTVLAGSTIWLKFNWDIDPASFREAFSIFPSVSGQFIFKDAHYVAEFVPDKPLDKSTVYTVSLSKLLRHFDGMNMENDFSFQFKTASRNELKMLASYPMKNETHIDYKLPTFTFMFDKELQTAELINGIQVYDKQRKIIPKIPRSLSHNFVQPPYGSTRFTLSEDLIPGEKYVVKLAKGIKDVDGVYLADTLFVPFTASDERQSDKPVVENFETTGKMSVNTVQSKGVVSANVSSSSSTKLFDTYSYKFTYSFSEKSGGEALYEFNSPDIIVPKDSVVGMHIYGDLSGNDIYLTLKLLNGENTYDVKMDNIHYGGWKFIEKSLTNLIPMGDSLMLTGFKVIQTSAPLSNTGSFFVDNILVYGNIISKAATPSIPDVKIFPNPTVEIVYVESSPIHKTGKIELYNLMGIKLKETHNTYLNVSDISQGTYILRIKIGHEFVSFPLMIKNMD